MGDRLNCRERSRISPILAACAQSSLLSSQAPQPSLSSRAAAGARRWRRVPPPQRPRRHPHQRHPHPRRLRLSHQRPPLPRAPPSPTSSMTRSRPTPDSSDRLPTPPTSDRCCRCSMVTCRCLPGRSWAQDDWWSSGAQPSTRCRRSGSIRRPPNPSSRPTARQLRVAGRTTRSRPPIRAHPW